jgi:AcrR family transcriptional regulator
MVHFIPGQVQVGKKIATAKILGAALDLFSEKGYAETKMTDVAQKVGMSVGALYLRFKSKEDLCRELIMDQTGDYEKLTSSLVEANADPVQALHDYITFCLGYALKKKKLISMIYREHRLSFLRTLRNRFMKKQLALIEGMLSEGVRQRKLRRLDTEQTALMIFACIRGAVMLKVFFGVSPAKEMNESLFALIFGGIGKDAPCS